MTEYIEFYIACNPLLLPQGVSEVIRRVQETEGLLEILYEPDVPWFKCVALVAQKTNIIANVQDNILAIADEDVDVFDVEEETDGDICIISPDPRMTSWSGYKTKGSDAFTYNDADIFPEPIVETKYKTWWRGLEAHPAATFADLLRRCHTYGDGSIPAEHDKFQDAVRCQISYNIRQTLLYIGSDDSRERVDATIALLERMTQVYESSWDGELPTLPSACEAVPTVAPPAPTSDDPFDIIPADVNMKLQPCIQPGPTDDNEGTLIQDGEDGCKASTASFETCLMDFPEAAVISPETRKSGRGLV